MVAGGVARLLDVRIGERTHHVSLRPSLVLDQDPVARVSWLRSAGTGSRIVTAELRR